MIINQGETSFTFYLLQEGACSALKSVNNQPPTVVYAYKAGDYFGELALINNEPR
jgi:cAMP-dependent protein kinase regulator